MSWWPLPAFPAAYRCSSDEAAKDCPVDVAMVFGLDGKFGGVPWLARLLPLFGLLLSLGCGGAPTTGGGGGQGGGAAGAGGAGGSAHRVRTCSPLEAQHAAVCPGDCPITAYWEVSCDHHLQGFDVVATADSTFLGAASEWETWLLGTQNGELVPLDDAPLENTAAPLVMATGPSGRLVLATHEREPDVEQLVGVTLVSQADTGFDRSLLAAGEESPVYLELLVDDDDAPHVFYRGGAASPWSLPARPADTSGFTRVSRTDDGEPVLFSVRQEGGPSLADIFYQLLASHGEDTVEVGPTGRVLRHSHGSFGSPRYRPLRPVVPPAIDVVPFYGAVVQHADALHVVGYSGGAQIDVALPGTAQPELDCPVIIDRRSMPCTNECVENKDSLEHQAFAAARGARDVWVAYAVEYFGTRGYYATSDDGTPVCHVIDGPESTEFVVARVPLDGTPPSTVFSVRIDDYNYVYTYTTIYNDHGPVAAHLFGDQLVVAISTRSSGRLRVFRVDTSLVER
jgi:hypothetical protein